MNLNPMFIIAKKEIMDNIRNKWIIILSIIFFLLTLVVSYFGSLYSEGWQDLDITISGMMNLVQFLVPIIALILGYAAIIGEIERGSMSALLSQPTSRIEIVLGKFIGLGSIISITIIAGFGIAGFIIALNVTNTNFIDYLIFIASTILLGLIFLSLAIFFSTLFKKRLSRVISPPMRIWTPSPYGSFAKKRLFANTFEAIQMPPVSHACPRPPVMVLL